VTTVLLGLLGLLGLVAGAILGYLCCPLTSTDASTQMSAFGPETAARSARSGISSDVRRAEWQIRRLGRPSPGRRPRQP
jgi:hypothetical protein